ncbi:MAG: TonB-dependent receptor [Pseudomonadota bacterium]
MTRKCRTVCRMALVLATIVPATTSYASNLQRIDIPAQSLSSAIAELGNETGLQISAPSEAINGKQSASVKGVMTPMEALRVLLSGTNLNIQAFGRSTSIQAQSAVITEGGNGNSTVLDRITVTGGSSEAEDLALFRQDSPETTVMFGEEEVEKRNINDIESALQQTPNVNVTGNGNPGQFAVTVRGLGDLGNVDSTAPSVGFFIDGAPLSTNGALSQGINAALVDVEAVEVSLGPQTTGFSRVTTAGAVNVVTKKPTGEFEASLETEFGSFSDIQLTAIVNQPILDDDLLNSRLVLFGGASDGFIDFVNGDDNSSENYGFRYSLRSQPTDQLTIDASISYSEDEQDGANIISLATLDFDDPVSFVNTVDEVTSNVLLARFQIENSLNSGTFTSSSSYRFSDTENVSDGDDTPFDISLVMIDNENTSFTQEFKYEGEAIDLGSNNGTLTLNAGTSLTFAEFQSEDDSPFLDAFAVLVGLATLTDPTSPIDFPTLLGLLGLPPTTSPFDLTGDGSGFTSSIDQDLFSFSVYGDATWRPVDQLAITGGLRYSFDQVVDESEITITPGLGTIAQLAGILPPNNPLTTTELQFNNFAPTASIAYDWTDNLSTYFTFATGFRPGGITGNPTGIATFDEEQTFSYEAGFRSLSEDGRLAIAGSAFFIQYEDLQTVISGFIPGIGVFTSLDNAGAAQSFGGEVSIAAKPTDALTFSAQAGFTNSQILEFDTVPGAVGSSLPNSPEFTFNIIGEYEHPEELYPGVKGFFRTEYNIRSSFVGAIAAAPIRLPGYDVLNFRAGLRSDSFDLTAFVENVLDERFATTASGVSPVSGPIPTPETPVTPISAFPGLDSPLVTPGETRRYGVVAKFKF